MATKELSYKITTDAKQGVAGIKQFGTAVKRELKGVDDALDDTRTSGQKAADALAAMADQMDAELKGAAAAADALGAALGTTADKLDVGQAVADLHKMGLTFDEIAAEADALAAAIKKIDDVQVTDTGLRDVGDDADYATQNVKELGNSSDQSGSVMANMAGNTASELGELGGVAGTAGQAIGQLAEYAAEGNISLSELAKVAGPMAGLAAAGILAAEAMKEHAKRAEIAKKQMEGWADAIAEGGDVVANLTKAQRESNAQIEATRKMSAGAYLPFIDSTEQLNDNLAAVSLTAEQFNQMAFDGDAAIGAWANAQIDAGTALKDVMTIVNAARDSHKGLGQAQASAAANLVVFGDAVDDVANRQRLAQTASEGVANVLAQEAIAQQSAADAAEAHAQAQDDIAAAAQAATDALQAQVDGFLNSADAQLAAVDASEAFAETLKDSEASVDDQRDAAVTAAKANVTWAESLAQATGKTLGAADKVDTLNDSLIDNAAQAKGPSRQAILDYIGALNGIDETKKTEISAAIAAGDLETAKRLLDEASVPRAVAITADAKTATANAALDAAARDRTATITGKVILPNGWTLDKYGQAHGPGGITVNSVLPPIAAPIAPVAQPLGPSQQAAGSTPMSGGTFAITINTRAPDGRETARALDRWMRVNGARYR